MNEHLSTHESTCRAVSRSWIDDRLASAVDLPTYPPEAKIVKRIATDTIVLVILPFVAVTLAVWAAA